MRFLTVSHSIFHLSEAAKLFTLCIAIFTHSQRMAVNQKMKGGCEMADTQQYEAFVRPRITELRMSKAVSEHRMSLDLGKSGSYIRGITSGAALPLLRELFNIIAYFDMTPADFFAPLQEDESLYHKLCEQLKSLNDDDLKKVATFINWIEK